MRLWAALALAACHADICERDEKNDRDCGVAHPNELTKACKASLDGCDGDDRDELDRYMDCKDEAGANECSPTTQAYVDALDCLGDLTLSETCSPDLAGAAGT